MIYDFINEICTILNIPVPSVSFDTSNFATDTMMAQVDIDGETLYLKKYDKPNPDQLFSIAHELRHIWQTKDSKALYFSEYKPIDLCSCVEEYNLQLAEIDANAFAVLIMADFFHLKPTFPNVSETVKRKIYEHVEQLANTEISQ